MAEPRHMAARALTVGSITHLGEDHTGAHVCTGSHGGLAVGRYALFRRVCSLICHDAGIGMDDAGIRALEFLDTYGLAAAAVDHRTARIGDSDDMVARGIISCVNRIATDCGVAGGMSCARAFEIMQKNAPAPEIPENIVSGVFRRIAVQGSCEIGVHALDSASSITDEDAGHVVVTGSHGGLPGAVRGNAIKAKVMFAAFNDAGVGIDEAGIARLAALDDVGVAAVAVCCRSARIGDGLSTYETGTVSHANHRARSLGAAHGIPLRDYIDQLLRKLPKND
ncbi:MAG: hypothetical protein MPJ78_12035 [Hyphomicrobiaceae bacterium]|nr:hypothetical protein [Hyphomicrobiaceae bacterium]